MNDLISPTFIITDVNSDIGVIDRTSENDGRVVILGKEGDAKWTYQGHPQINTEDTSKPLFEYCIPFIPDTQYNVIVISKVNSSWL
jgi:hypothetical protein